MAHAVSWDTSYQDDTAVVADGAEGAVGVVEPLVPPEVVTNNTEELIVFQSSRSIEELIVNGPADCNVEEEV